MLSFIRDRLDRRKKRFLGNPDSDDVSRELTALARREGPQSYLDYLSMPLCGNFGGSDHGAIIFYVIFYIAWALVIICFALVFETAKFIWCAPRKVFLYLNWKKSQQSLNH